MIGKIALRVLSFAFFGALTMALVGAVEGAILAGLIGFAFGLIGFAFAGFKLSAFLTGAYIAAKFGFVSGALIFMLTGLLVPTSQPRQLFLLVWIRAAQGSLLGLTLGGASLGVMLGLWDKMVRGNSQPWPFNFGGMITGTTAGCIVGASLGAWRGVQQFRRRVKP